MDYRAESRRNFEYLPVNIAILSAFAQSSDTHYAIDAVPVEMVEIVFKVEDVAESAMRYDIQFSDEYGEFLGVIYRKSERPSPALRGYDLRHRGYALAVGNIKRFSDTVLLVIARISAVNNYAEVLNHRLRVIWAHYKRTGGRESEQSVMGENRQGTGEGTTLMSEIVAVVKRLNPYQNRRGVHHSAILSQMQTKVSAKELEMRINEMLASGYLAVGEQAGCFLINSP